VPTETFNFLEPEIGQADLVAFANDRVNLKREYRDKYREQLANLRNHLDRYISEHPEIGLVQMRESGSLAKGTALSTINDIDVALYVKSDGAPHELPKLLQWLVERLRTTYHQIASDRIYIDGPCVVIAFSGTDLKVEVAPILYEGDPKWRGYLFDRITQKKILTSIPMHLEFIRSRKEKHAIHFRQVIRLLKWWVKQREVDTSGFHLRSFLVELLVAKCADDGCGFDDYHAALEYVFVYIQKTGLKERIAFSDYYRASALPKEKAGVVEIFDPVNPENNVATDVTETSRRQLVEMSAQALDTLAYARTCQTKGEALECWREIMGGSFTA
jgi:tRNA nucleotidyltransferase (CCA-adding enzyme)